ncbi:hypothetical protein LV457_09325 [Mycobacterium sp. MYCO198283]|uniref:hypothetical protein n=1 Tax=Mycobacterium sp. MYCO198283 TaxID=2883505 RepID=UPI001E3B06D1|nr:hypothetical protein [Mycobacterium sp. MYCO198283]MCG5432490.1 hypothetical protein [Mycobacterium sp. MYCO198283]
MSEVFIGSEAIAAGRLTRHELSRWYRPVFRGVYLPTSAVPMLRDRTTAAWLATDRRGVIAGVAASALHGASWVDDDHPIEVIDTHRRPQRGLTIRNESLADDEVTRVAGLPVTTRARTAFDLGRHLPRDSAIGRLDALKRASAYDDRRVEELLRRYSGLRGTRQLRELLPLVDKDAASPPESRVRLLLIDAGLPAPQTQILVVHRSRLVAMLDMGWEALKIAVEYDGDHHRTDRRQYARDVRRYAELERRGWIVIRVLAGDKPADILRRVVDAFRRRDIHLSLRATRTFAA